MDREERDDTGPVGRPTSSIDARTPLAVVLSSEDHAPALGGEQGAELAGHRPVERRLGQPRERRRANCVAGLHETASVDEPIDLTNVPTIRSIVAGIDDDGSRSGCARATRTDAVATRAPTEHIGRLAHTDDSDTAVLHFEGNPKLCVRSGTGGEHVAVVGRRHR